MFTFNFPSFRSLIYRMRSRKYRLRSSGLSSVQIPVNVSWTHSPARLGYFRKLHLAREYVAANPARTTTSERIVETLPSRQQRDRCVRCGCPVDNAAGFDTCFACVEEVG